MEGFLMIMIGIAIFAKGKTYEEAIEGWLEVMESKHSPDPSRLVEVAV